LKREQTNQIRFVLEELLPPILRDTALFKFAPYSKAMVHQHKTSYVTLVLQGELRFKGYEKISLDVKPKLLEKTLKRKSELLAKAKAVYESVIEYQDLKWATASLYRVGQIFDSFAEALRTAPTPGGLSEAESAAYREALDTYVIEIEEKSIELFSGGYQKAIQMQVYDSYTKKIREALGRLASQQYPPERESRSDVRTGDRPLKLELVEEVER